MGKFLTWRISPLVTAVGLLFLGILNWSTIHIGAGLLLALACIIYPLGALFYLFSIKFKQESRIPAAFCGVNIFIVWGISFRLLKWPGGAFLMLIGGALALLLGLVIFIYLTRKDKHQELPLLYGSMGLSLFAFALKCMLWEASWYVLVLAFIAIVYTGKILLENKYKLNMTYICWAIITVFTIGFCSLPDRNAMYIIHLHNTSPEYTTNPYRTVIYALEEYEKGNPDVAYEYVELAMQSIEEPENLLSFDIARSTGGKEKYKQHLNWIRKGRWHRGKVEAHFDEEHRDFIPPTQAYIQRLDSICLPPGETYEN